MKFEREYLLRADLKEEVEEWITKVKWVDADICQIEQLVDMIFYRLLHAGDLKERRPTSFSPKKWLVEITGLSDKEIEEKISRTMGKIRKGEEGRTVGFIPKSLKMKVDDDSPFKGEVL